MSIKDTLGNLLGLNRDDVTGPRAVIAQWPERPRLGAEVMLAAYGPPQEVSDEQLIWREQGKYKVITVTRTEHHHDFPKPHMDFIEHTIRYHVPPDRVIELTKYDGSLTFDRTRGEMSARCDLEGHNILTLNLANDIALGRIDAEEARRRFSEIVTTDIEGGYPDYTTDLRFAPHDDTEAMFSDVPTITGSPERPDGMTHPRGDAGDGEVLGFIAAADELEAVSAIVAHSKKTGAGFAAFVQSMHEEHGQHLVATLALGQQIGVTPLETKKIDVFRRLNAGRLADITALDGDEFETAWLAGKIQGHTELIAVLDGLMAFASSDAVKRHLESTKAAAAAHLDEMKQR